MTVDHASSLLPARASFGLNVKRPWELQTRSTGEILLGIRDGEWREPVSLVRSLPHDSEEQKQAKEALPFWTPAGEFSYRANSNLIRHSGLYGVDLDGLTVGMAILTLQRAVADTYCLAAFRSCRLGVRLIFRVPPCSAAQHSEIFPQVVDHVQKVYYLTPDTSGHDVCRAVFVSWDNGLWLFPRAELLPITLPTKSGGVKHNGLNRCVSSRLGARESVWSFLGREHGPHESKPDGTAYTHYSLVKLGLRLALQGRRLRLSIEDADLDEALEAWAGEARRKGLKLRGTMAAYRSELRESIDGAPRKTWFRDAAEFWTQWRNDPSFPEDPKARVLFAIQQYCERANTVDFYLSARDAGQVAGVNYVTAWRILGKLCKEGCIELVNRPKMARQAFEYRLREYHNAIPAAPTQAMP